MPLSTSSLPLDEHFLRHVARCVLDRFSDPSNPAQLTTLRIVIPNLLLAPALGEALARETGGPLLLPVIDTLPGTLSLWENEFEVLPDARRQLILHGLLRRHNWFHESALWDVVSELTALFDRLTEHSQRLPDDEAELAAQLERAFGLRNSVPLAFEARVAHTLWRAESQGSPSRAAARAMAAARWARQINTPLCILAEGRLDVQNEPLLSQIVLRCAERVPVLILRPERRQSEGALANTLYFAWPPVCDSDKNPGEPDIVSSGRANDLCAQPLIDRAAELSEAGASAATQRIQFATADGLESLANAVSEKICQWLVDGKRQIALIAADRLAARRARALLERRGVLVADETGWKLSTTRAAASVDAWIELLVSDAYHRTLVDLLKSPFLFGDLSAERRANGALQIERLLSRHGIVGSLDVVMQTLQDREGNDAAKELISRLLDARRIMPASGTLTIVQWLQRLEKALESLGARNTLAYDVAGSDWLKWLKDRRNELGEDTERFSLTHWRQWFNREMDATFFIDRSVTSTVVLTSLAATRLRVFDAAIVIGADNEHLKPPQQPVWLAHDGVRRELGLPGKDIERARLREDLAGLALCSGETVFAWQHMQRQEHLLPSADLEVLIRMLNMGLDDSVVCHISGAPHEAELTDHAPHGMPMPSVPAERIPQRVSASALRNLLACPYQYFAHYVLGLKELDEVSEALEKRDFGEQLHALLQGFHSEFPVLAGHDEDELLMALQRHTEKAFAPLVARNFLDHAWRVRWLAHLPSYIAWQLEREREGWHFSASEESVEKNMPLSDGSTLTLNGRIDRIDVRNEAFGLIDYKARKLGDLRKQAADPDDVQLAFYTLLKDDAVSEAAYVSVDDEKIDQANLPEPAAAAEILGERIDHIFVRLRAGAGMPANGAIDGPCAWCEARGLCRKDWHT
ncbi:MAG TPA: PD-(D/E)XK nuclease family protein [Rhodocyclaceae bacterium]|nr:PD-(D/E)XK nuclease family protein [Rhodocyclaceae bacterium]